MVLRKFAPFCVITLVLSSCSGNQTSEATGSVDAPINVDLNEANATEGAELFKQHCIACHGADGKMGLGGSADLTLSIIDTTEIVEIVNNGRKGMPAFKDILSNEKNVLSVTAFVLELRK